MNILKVKKMGTNNPQTKSQPQKPSPNWFVNRRNRKPAHISLAFESHL